MLVKDCWFFDNCIIGDAVAAVDISKNQSGFDNCRGSTFENCKILSNGGSGIHVFVDDISPVFKNNIIRENKIGVVLEMLSQTDTKKSVGIFTKSGNVIEDNKKDISIDTVVEDPVTKAVEEGVCTFFYTKGRFYLHGQAYECRTHGLDTICVVCKETEHQDCDLKLLEGQNAQCFCDCGMSNKECKNMKKVK